MNYIIKNKKGLYETLETKILYLNIIIFIKAMISYTNKLKILF